MSQLFRRIFAVLLCAAAFAGIGAQAQTTAPKVLVLYDAPSGTAYDKIGFAYAIMLRNLLGHFDAQVTMSPADRYTPGAVNAYDATFYLGASYDFPVSQDFLADAATTNKPLVWFKYNLWQLAWNSTYNFTVNRGISFAGLRGMNAAPTASEPAPGFFDTINYKNKPFVKYYAWDSARNVINADPDIGVVQIADASRASTLVTVSNPKSGEVAPYVVRSGNFWYVADVPFSFIGPRDRYLVLADLLHDMLGIHHAESHKAMIRLEDVGAMVSVANMKTLSNYLSNKKIPFSVATIPHYVDALGIDNDGVPLSIPLSQATNLKKALTYAVGKGGEIVMHGFTHQYSNLRNPYTSISGDDYEFWNIVANSPVAEDSASWVRNRLQSGLSELGSNGYRPVAWEMPHYQGSATAYRTTPSLFNTTYQRVVYYTADYPNFTAATGKDLAVGQIFPYIINRDYYGQRVLPENLGNFEYDLTWMDPTANIVYTWQDIYTNAQYAMTVRDGFASFFFHPFLLNPDLGINALDDLKRLVDGINKLGYQWTTPSQLH